MKTFGRLDTVVSNAGWTRVTDFFNLDEQTLESDWDKCFLYNVKSHMWLFAAAKPHLAVTEGAFISTASLAGVKPSGSSVPYAVTKSAQIHLAKCLAVICGSSGIRVNSVSPGLLLTEWGQKFGEEKIRKNIDMTKLGRLAEVDDIAEQVRTLTLSRSITGQNIVIDAGTSL
jgi:NAD(P)-dependent dehydrogenase (short-subunit alcohol dehydrogenase family)